MKIVKKASEKLRNLSIGYKLVLLVYLSALVLFILLTAALYIRSREIALEEFVSSHLRICSSGNQLVDEERSYMLGVAEYYSLASDIQSILMASNSGNSAGLPNAFLDSVSQRRNLSSMTFYTTSGRPVDFISIDNSSCPLPQSTARGTIFYSLISGGILSVLGIYSGGLRTLYADRQFSQVVPVVSCPSVPFCESNRCYCCNNG